MKCGAQLDDSGTYPQYAHCLCVCFPAGATKGQNCYGPWAGPGPTQVFVNKTTQPHSSPTNTQCGFAQTCLLGNICCLFCKWTHISGDPTIQDRSLDLSPLRLSMRSPPSSLRLRLVGGGVLFSSCRDKRSMLLYTYKNISLHQTSSLEQRLLILSDSEYICNAKIFDGPQDQMVSCPGIKNILQVYQFKHTKTIKNMLVSNIKLSKGHLFHWYLSFEGFGLFTEHNLPNKDPADLKVQDMDESMCTLLKRGEQEENCRISTCSSSLVSSSSSESTWW